MTGLPSRISEVQNENTLIFLLRSNRIYLSPLDEESVASSYERAFLKEKREIDYVALDKLSQAVRGQTDRLLDYIMSEFPRFLEPVFEKAAGDWLWKNKELPIGIRTIAHWWGPNPVKKREEEVDIVAPDFTNNKAIIGECKWRPADKVKPEMIDTLIERSFLIPKIRQHYLYFFAKEVTDGFRTYAKEKNVKVVEYDDFFKEIDWD